MTTEPTAAADVGPRRFSAGRLLVLILVAGLVVVLVRGLLVQSFIIPSGSMEPTLQVGDRVLVSRWDYRFGQVRRGDVIVFDGTGVFDPEPPEPAPLAAVGRAVAAAMGVPVGRRDYVKRVVGLPGERITCCDLSGRITVDGASLDEPYLQPGDVPSLIRFDIKVPAGRLWVMGDHRSDSGDSREHLGDPGGGTVPLDHVIGRVVTVWWPPGHAGGIGRSEAAAPRGTVQEAAQ